MISPNGNISRREVRRLLTGSPTGEPLLLAVDLYRGENLPLVRSLLRSGFSVSVLARSLEDADRLAAAGLPCHLQGETAAETPEGRRILRVSSPPDPLWLSRPRGMILSLIPTAEP